MRTRAALRFAALTGTVVSGVLLLASCNQGGDVAPEATDVPRNVASDAPAARVIESNYGTPVKDRVATIGLLNKRNNLTQDLVLKTGEARRIGNVVIKLANCERTLPWEDPPEVGAFLQLWVEERASVDKPLAWRKIFSGWLFRNSPSVNVVEHPVYDVWVKDCAMKFPGEEEDPAALASSAAKPSGKDKAPVRPVASPSPGASPAPSPAAPVPVAAPAAPD